MLSKISMPLFMDGTTLSPQTPTNVIITSFLAAWLSQWYALRKHPKWYEKYSEFVRIVLSCPVFTPVLPWQETSQVEA